MELIEFRKCQMKWSGWRGTIKEFIKNIRTRQLLQEQETTNHSDKEYLTKNLKYSSDLPTIVMIIQSFDSCQGLLPMGEILLVMSIKVQKRIQLLTHEDKLVTLPFSSNLKFQECIEDPQGEAKSRNLRSLIGRKSANDDRELIVRLTEDFVKDINDYPQCLSGPLRFLECYEENFLICIPVRNESGKDLSRRTAVTIPAYYPIQLATVKAFIDADGTDKLEDLYKMFMSTYCDSELPASSAILEELTISSLPGDLYEDIEDVTKIDQTTINYDNKNDSGRSSLIRSAALPFESKIANLPTLNAKKLHLKNQPAIVNCHSDFFYFSQTASFQNLPIVDSKICDESKAFFRYKNKRNFGKKKNNPGTPGNKTSDQQIFFGNQFASIPKNLFTTKNGNDLKSNVKIVHNRSIEEKAPLTSSKSMADINMIGRYEDYRTQNRCLTSAKNTQKLETVARNSSKDVSKVDDKADKLNRNTALGQFFSIFKKSKNVKENNRNKKSLSCFNAENNNNMHRSALNHQDFAYFLEIPPSSAFGSSILSSSKAGLNDSYSCSTNEYDNIGSPCLRNRFEENKNTSYERPLSKSLDALNEMEDDSSRNSERFDDHAGELNSCHPATQSNILQFKNNDSYFSGSIMKFASMPNQSVGITIESKEDNRQTTFPDQIREVQDHDSNYEEILSPKKIDSSDILDNYVEMGTTYVMSDSESVKSFTSTASKWSTLHDVPEDLGELLVNEVCMCLELLNLGKHVKRFAEEQIDGELLCSLTEEILQNDLMLSKFETLKLIKFVKEGWRPK